MNKTIVIIVLLVGLLFSLPVAVFAAGPGLGQKIVAYQETLVPEGQIVKNVLLVGKDGIIAGQVNDEVIVIKGSLTLKSSAKVADRVFVIGGDIKQEPGAQVGKGVFNISTSNATVNSFMLGLVTFAGIELIKLVLSGSLILAALIVILVAPAAAENSAAKLKGAMFKSAILGILGLICFGLLIAVLTKLLWGIPLAVSILLLLIVLIIIGCTGMSLVFGELFKKGLDSSLQSPLIITAIGSLLLVAMLNLPIVGPIWAVIVIIFALGATIQILFKKKAAD
ncbi:hypothetical protein [Thermincola ferriacetica]